MRKFLGQYRTIFLKKQRRSFVIISLILILGSALETLTISLMYPFMYLVMGTSNVDDSKVLSLIFSIFRCETDRDGIIIMSIVIALIYLVKGLYSIFSNYFQNKRLSNYRAELSTRLFHSILSKPYEYHLHSNSAITQRIINEDIKRIFDLINSIFMLVSELFTGTFIFAVLMIDNAKMTLYAVALVATTTLFVNKFITKIIQTSGVKATKYETKMIQWISQTMGALKGILVNQNGKSFEENYSYYAYSYANVRMKYLVLASLPRTITESVSIAGIFIYMGFLAMTQDDIVGMLPLFATFALAAIRLIPIFGRMNSAINTIQYNINIFENTYELLSDNSFTADSGREMLSAFSMKDKISVEHLDFKFSDSGEYLFKDVSLEIPVGSSIAFVGTTGSGKTTLADIIMGLHQPSNGKITCDGKDINEISSWWSSVIGYIPQSIYLCDDTIASNVAFGVKEELIDYGRVWECLKEAQLYDFVKGLPNELNTITGENGIRLSGGQRQRIGIARALYTDPAFLVMDEATSALDNDTEAAIVDAVNQLSGKKTLLIIAHRLSTIRDCDIIYRVQNGKVIREKG